MKKYLGAILISLLVLVGCSSNQVNDNNINETNNEENASNQTNVDENENTENLGNEENEVEDEFIPLTEEEAREIVFDNLSEMTEVTLETAQHEAFYSFETSFDSFGEAKLEIDQVEGDLADQFEKVKDVFKDNVSSTYLDDMYYEYMYAIIISNHMDFLHPGDMGARLQIEDQDEDTFTYSFITLADEAGFAFPRTNYLTLVKEDDDWKISNYETVTYEEEPFDLTEDEIAQLGENPPYRDMDYDVEVLDVVEENGDTFIVYYNKASEDRYIEAINANTSEYNMQLAMEYD